MTPTESSELVEIVTRRLSEKKPFVRRVAPDRSQRVRRTVQAAFLLLNLYIGAQFYFFVRQFEVPGSTFAVSRPAGVEGWLPIASLMNLKAFLLTGEIPPLHPAGMFLLLSFLAMSLLLRKAFCGWLCPVGTISEYLWKQGKKTFGRSLTLPRWLDIPMRGLKYVLLALFVWVVATMPVEGIRAFLGSPYGLVADVKMLDFFRLMTLATAAVLGVLALASFFVPNFWCRYLCPYGALMGLAALASPVKIRRDAARCNDCGKCARACPSRLPVDKKLRILSAECLGCMECVSVCPAQDALAMKAPGNRTVPAWAMAAAVALVFVGFVGYAKLSGHWDSHIPRDVYQRLIPEARLLSHPR